MLSIDEIQRIRKLVSVYIESESSNVTMLARNNFERELMQASAQVQQAEQDLKSNHFSAISYMLIGRAIADVEPDLLLKIGQYSGFKN